MATYSAHLKSARMIKLLLDNMVDPLVQDGLQNSTYELDVVHLRDVPEGPTLSDPEVMQLAMREERVVLTRNGLDIVPLYQSLIQQHDVAPALILIPNTFKQRRGGLASIHRYLVYCASSSGRPGCSPSRKATGRDPHRRSMVHPDQPRDGLLASPPS